MKTKILTILLSAMALTACGDSDTANKTQATSATQTTNSAETSSALTSSQTPSATTASTSSATLSTSHVGQVDVSKLSPEKVEMLEKSKKIGDIIALQQAYLRANSYQNGMDKAMQWQQRLISAKSDAEIREVFNEQMVLMDNLLREVNNVKLYTPEVQSIADKMKRGIEQTKSAYQQMSKLNLMDPTLGGQAQPLMEQVTQGGGLIFSAHDDLIKLVQSLGFTTNDEAMTYYQHAKQQFNQITSK